MAMNHGNYNGNGHSDRRLSYENTRNVHGVRRRRIPTKYKVTIAAILVLYTALLSAVTYFMLYKPNTGGRDVFYEYETDEFGNTIEKKYEYTQIDGTYNFLVLGMDKEASLTDVCMLVNFDTRSGKISLMQLPRDTYVSSVDGVNNNTGKLNELFADHRYSRMRNGESDEDSYKGALDDVTELLEKSLCIRINFSVIMDLEGFRGIVDAVGGVEMTLPNALYYSDPEQGLYINLPAGYQVLNGEQAEQFVRFRSDYNQGDLGRVNAQKMFISAFFTRLKSCGVSNAADIAEEVFDNVTCDLSVGDVVFFAKKLMSADLSNITMQTLPGLVSASGTYYVMNRAATLSVINERFNVYDSEVKDGIFDSSMMFVRTDSSDITDCYYAASSNVYDGNIYSGDSVAEDGIDIPFKK